MATLSDGLDRRAAEFCAASIADWTGKAARMLAETPELASHSLATALVLGDEARVRQEIERDPSAATRTDPQTGWTALHVVCASKWPKLDPDRTAGLVATARLLLDAGADPNARVGPDGRSAGSSALRCAAAAASSGVPNAAVIRLLVERGATVGDDDLYLAAFGPGDHACLHALLDGVPGGAALAEKALSAPISTKDVTAVRLLLDAGADPRRFADDDGQPSAAVYAAVRADCPAELIAMLVEHGADPHQPGPDGHSPAWLAAIRGRDDLTGLLGEASTDAARFVGACVRGDRTAATSLAAADPGLMTRLEHDELAALVPAAGAGKTAAVELMLDLGFPVNVRGEDGTTPLHVAAYAGSAEMVRLLLDRGADLTAPDGTWQSAPLDWAVVGSGYRPATCPDPDWVGAVRLLIEAGASTAGISLSPDDAKPPSAEVAELLRSYGVGAD
ncbi:MAG TPA: ankyrin repeat domain-containing protein [Streptosporangiaceae bacterium]